MELHRRTGVAGAAVPDSHDRDPLFTVEHVEVVGTPKLAALAPAVILENAVNVHGRPRSSGTLAHPLLHADSVKADQVARIL